MDTGYPRTKPEMLEAYRTLTSDFKKKHKIYSFLSWTNKFHTKSIENGQYVFRIKEDKVAGFSTCNTLDCKPCASPAPCKAVPCQEVNFHAELVNMAMAIKQEQEKASTMYKDERTEAQQAKDYLIKSLDYEIERKVQPMQEAFGLVEKQVRTIGELKAAEKAGWLRLVIPSDAKDEARIYSWFDYIKFSDPKVKPDEEGYKAARKQMKIEASAVKDQIVVMGPEKGLEALNAFKAKTFH